MENMFAVVCASLIGVSVLSIVLTQLYHHCIIPCRKEKNGTTNAVSYGGTIDNPYSLI